MSETTLSKAIRDRLAAIPGVHVWRNNVGAVKHRGFFVRYGLCNGSSDIIGIIDGRFVAIEVKRPVKPEPLSEDQAAFIALIRRQGGFACVVKSVEEAVAAVARAKTGAVE